MGIVVEEVAFDGPAPELPRIAEKLTELSGLPVSVTESGPDVKSDLYDYHGHLGFACAADLQLNLFAYRTGAVRRFVEESFGGVDSPIANHVTGMNEPEGTQSVHLRGYVGQEPTLLFMTTFALEELGGRPRHPLDDATRREYQGPITPGQLDARRRQAARQLWPVAVAGCLLLPVLIPVYFVVAVVRLPWRIWRGYRLYREHQQVRGGQDESS